MEGTAIKALRERLGLSITAFAQLVGVQRSTIYRWQSGERVPRGLSCRALEVLAQQQSSPGSSAKTQG